jgi:hypothetical protein
MEDSILDKMAKFIEGFIVLPLNDSVLFGRDYRIDALLLGQLNDGVGIVTAVSQQVVSLYALDEP